MPDFSKIKRLAIGIFADHPSLDQTLMGSTVFFAAFKCNRGFPRKLPALEPKGLHPINAADTEAKYANFYFP